MIETPAAALNSIPTLLKLVLRSLSVAPPLVPSAKQAIRQTNFSAGSSGQPARCIMRRCLAALAFVGLACADGHAPDPDASPPARVASLDSADIAGLEKATPAIRSLLEICLSLTKQNLGYKFGSSDPAAGGMDCSGTIYHVLRASGIADAPRTASGQYVWVRKAGTFQAVISRDAASFELDDLQAGDLLFWTGTYSTKQDPPVSHTMIYLGKRRSDRKQVMFGASDGRTYDGRKIWGVSVFDFKITGPIKKSADGRTLKSESKFIGYARIPGLGTVAR